MKRRLLGGTAVGLALTAGLAACGTTPTHTSAPGLATVNGQPVTQAEVTNFVNGTEFMNQQKFATTASEKKAELHAVVAQSAVTQWVLAHHLTTRAKAAKTANTIIVSQIETALGGSASLKTLLTSFHLTQKSLVTYLTDQVVAQSAYQKVSKGVKKPTAAQEQAFYKANRAQLFVSPPEDKLSDILVKTSALAQSILKQAESGTSFATLAKQYSLESSGKTGGSMGYVVVSGTSLSQGMYTAVQGMKAGQFKTYHGTKGYHVIWLEAIKPQSFQPYAKVKSTVQTDETQNLDNQAYQRLVTSLEKKDKIHYAKKP